MHGNTEVPVRGSTYCRMTSSKGIALDVSETQQRFMSLIPAINQQALLLFSVVAGRHKPGDRNSAVPKSPS